MAQAAPATPMSNTSMNARSRPIFSNDDRIRNISGLLLSPSERRIPDSRLYRYITGIPKKMTKQEYVEWALEDILTEIDDNTEILVSHLVASKDCICPITKIMNEALVKLIDRYDFVIFDCEYDLKYLTQLVDYPIDTTLLVTKPDSKSILLASKIYESNKKYAAAGQFSIILNQLKNGQENIIQEASKAYSLDILGVIQKYDDAADNNKVNYEATEIMKNLYSRLNLPQNIQFKRA